MATTNLASGKVEKCCEFDGSTGEISSHRLEVANLLFGTTCNTYYILLHRVVCT
jgi:hypothetical protein